MTTLDLVYSTTGKTAQGQDDCNPDKGEKLANTVGREQRCYRRGGEVAAVE